MIKSIADFIDEAIAQGEPPTEGVRRAIDASRRALADAMFARPDVRRMYLARYGIVDDDPSVN